MDFFFPWEAETPHFLLSFLAAPGLLFSGKSSPLKCMAFSGHYIFSIFFAAV